ncbi:MAG: SagB/ThcOx family dehydrogenase, partial [Candidatus Diapherotrites archaeon]
LKKKKIQDIFFQNFVSDASAILLITSVIGRSQIKYGLKSLKFSFIEAGHLGQNVLLYATKLDIGACAICGYDGQKAEKLLGIDGLSEGIVYVIALG